MNFNSPFRSVDLRLNSWIDCTSLELFFVAVHSQQGPLPSSWFRLHLPNTSPTVSVVYLQSKTHKNENTPISKTHISFNPIKQNRDFWTFTSWGILHCFSGGEFGAPGDGFLVGWGRFGRNSGRLGSGFGFWWLVIIRLGFFVVVVMSWIHENPNLWTVAEGEVFEMRLRLVLLVGWWLFLDSWKIYARSSPVRAGSNTSTCSYQTCLVVQISGGSIHLWFCGG